ncbi:hypothetical protein [Kitasatospora sp. NPDC001175]|uniref:hypothetical protein n=1 Tax=Kitasatospora sp. NPDC001175 TaxID=3157103 RepID=UPI003D06B392
MPASVPVWPTVVPGNYVTSALANTLSVNGGFLSSPPDFVGTQQTAQSIAATTWVALTMDTTQLDTYGGHSNTTNSSRYTCQSGAAGWYTVCGVAAFVVNNTGARASRLQVNGNPIAGACSFAMTPGFNAPGVATPTRDIYLNAGDYVEVAAWQNSGGAINTTINSDLTSALWVRWSHA